MIKVPYDVRARRVTCIFHSPTPFVDDKVLLLVWIPESGALDKKNTKKKNAKVKLFHLRRVFA